MGHKKTVREVQDFLSRNEGIIEQQPEIPRELFKAGVLPFYKGMGDRIEYLFMKPTPKHGSDPGIQIAKGSRLYMLDGKWKDSKDNPELATNPNAEPEPILVNAIREAMEELGLTLENIKNVLSGFATNYRVKGVGEERKMFLLPVEVKSKEPFLSARPEGIEELVWLDGKKLHHLRADFAKIASGVDDELKSPKHQHTRY